MGGAETIGCRRLYEEQLLENGRKERVTAPLREKNGKHPPALSNGEYGHMVSLQLKNKALEARIAGFESSEIHGRMMETHRREMAAANREHARMERENADLRRQIVNVRNIWSGIVDDLESDHARELQEKDRVIAGKDRIIQELRDRNDSSNERHRADLKEMYRLKTELEDANGRAAQLKAQINRNHENSSIPSSQKPDRRKITSNREPTGRKRGGQPGHAGHRRKRQKPTRTVLIPAPEEYAGSPDYRLTGRIITRQMVGVAVSVTVDEYQTPEFRHVRTGQRVHAGFPEGLVNEVNYDGSVKAFLFMLNSRCNVSIANASGFLGDLTGGALRISAGMINGLNREFSQKTGAEQRKAFADLLLSPVMHVDFTGTRVNGEGRHVAVCTDPSSSAVLYFARRHKGHEGVKGTPFEEYHGIGVHDHDITFYNYGDGHQECDGHVLRCLKGSMENEPGLQWNRQMRKLIQEMFHFRNSLDPDDDRDPDEIDPDTVRDLEARYDGILDLADREYAYEPPGKYNVEGYNLSRRLRKYKANHLLFLHDRRVPGDNNVAERLLRIIKRKKAQMTTFRSEDGLADLCACLGTVASLRASGVNLYDSVVSIFDRLKPG
jgi:hypothetical protein